MDIMKKSKLDWFSIDMEAFEQAYLDCLEALDESRRWQAQLEACENGVCAHDRKLKKDGTPNKSYPCPMLNAVCDAACKSNNALYYSHPYTFFKLIGLIKDDDE